MGTKKQEAIIRGNRNTANSFQRKMMRLDELTSLLTTKFSNLAGVINDDFRPMLEFKIYLKESGDFLGLVRRADELEEQIIFAGSDDFYECLDNLNSAMAKDKWRKSERKSS